MNLLASIQSGDVTGEMVSFEQSTSEVFWTTLPQGFGFALIVWIGSACVSVAFKIVKTA